MKKGLKKYTVPFHGTYFDGGKISGQRVVFATNAQKASEKLNDVFSKRDDEPMVYAEKAEKWIPCEKSYSEIYPYWGMDI